MKAPSRYVLVRLGFWLALVVLAAGVGLEFGWPWALIGFGGVAAMVLLLATETDGSEKAARRR